MCKDQAKPLWDTHSISCANAPAEPFARAPVGMVDVFVLYLAFRPYLAVTRGVAHLGYLQPEPSTGWGTALGGQPQISATNLTGQHS